MRSQPLLHEHERLASPQHEGRRFRVLSGEIPDEVSRGQPAVVRVGSDVHVVEVTDFGRQSETVTGGRVPPIGTVDVISKNAR